jgi:hypothetical protein
MYHFRHSGLWRLGKAFRDRIHMKTQSKPEFRMRPPGRIGSTAHVNGIDTSIFGYTYGKRHIYPISLHRADFQANFHFPQPMTLSRLNPVNSQASSEQVPRQFQNGFPSRFQPSSEAVPKTSPTGYPMNPLFAGLIFLEQ